GRMVKLRRVRRNAASIRPQPALVQRPTGSENCCVIPRAPEDWPMTALLLMTLLLPVSDDLKITADEQAVIDLVNAERKKVGQLPLKASPKLFEAARGHATNMARQDK